mmetsp:Transcript_163196/g.396629  ORF Transcript_163196/g.396629 Transcript_163196/m.396629 type:complete len:296 (+) Transcript_163196:138-1025(+)
MNYNTGLQMAYHSCASYGCDATFRPESSCQCNSKCEAFGNCCVDFKTQCRDAVPTLFCFVLMLSWTSELQLVQSHANAGVGIFGCKAHSVYSDKTITLRPEVARPGKAPAPAIMTTVVSGGSLAASKGGTFDTYLNTEVFTRVWQQVFEQDLFRQHDWTVKVDPDSVFLPGRLIEHLRPGQYGPHPREQEVYFNNCGYGFHGPIEIVSQKAMLHFSDRGMEQCKEERVSDWSKTGEDVFFKNCMAALGVTKLNDFGLLSEEHCGEKPSPCVSGKVAFHPFKGVQPWLQCLKEAQR